MKTRRKSSIFRVSVIMMICLLGFVFYIFVGFGPLRYAAISLTSVLRRIDSIFESVPRFFESRFFLQTENEHLKNQLNEVLIDYVEFETLRQENGELKNILNYTKGNNTQEITSRIISYSNNPFSRTILLDKGSEDGIIYGAPVLAHNNIFIGRIIELRKNSSLVLLAQDDHSKVPAKIIDQDGAEGVLEGYGVLYRLTLVPTNITIKPNDLVVTDVFESTIPAGLVIGTIERIESSADDPYQTAVILPPVSIKNISYVMVLINGLVP